MIEGLRIIVTPRALESTRQLRILQAYLTILTGEYTEQLGEFFNYEFLIFVHDQPRDLSDFSLRNFTYLYNQLIRAIVEYKQRMNV